VSLYTVALKMVAALKTGGYFLPFLGCRKIEPILLEGYEEAVGMVALARVGNYFSLWISSPTAVFSMLEGRAGK